ncbi:unnamed protein product [Rotaria sp. Silwood2]|nr:unnamed protein product [Rotaria sp. Silwood2]CAF3234268.1 unnamed protein product [Rotaria sp. Silwood2]CAF4003653.1 unnamed protein product [Rotaria sp. Silwood2]CAF4488199.1 unnamed protein product [Rotaria sp. Silwood2]
MRLRDLFRSQSNNERKYTSTILPVLDTNTFLNAVQDKDIDTLHKCLLAGFPPDQPDPITKATALHIAVETVNMRAIHMLLQAGAQVNVCDLSLSTPLHIAAYMGYEEIVQILLMHGADMFKQDNTGRNSFHLAVSTGNNRLVQHFISAIDIEPYMIHIPDAQNWTPLMCACASNHPSTCALLLSHGAYLCAMNDQGMTVLHIATFLGSLPIIYELLNSSIDDEIILKVLNQGDHRNQTPLFYACIEGHVDVALTLLHAGANAYHLDNDNQTCLHAMLSSSIILKRHIRLFYRFIEYVDFRFHQDHLSRTLLDLAYLNQINTIIYLLKLLNYKHNYNIISNNESYDNISTNVFSLRHLCILTFKRSIIYHQNRKQLTQHDLLEHALQQCFQINLNGYISSNDLFYRKSLEDISLTNKKTIKSTKKSRKTSNVCSSIQNDFEQSIHHTQSNWSIFTNKFKHQRTSSSQQELVILSTSLPQSSLLSNYDHPMKNLALIILKSPSKLDDLLDFPSLINNHLLYDDMKTVMNTYNLDGIDSSNQI